MKGALVFIMFFVLFLAIALVNISLPIANWIVQEYVSDIIGTDYEYLVEGSINGAVYGFVAWVIFTAANALYKRSESSKEKVLRAKRKTAAKPLPSSAKVEEIEGIGPVYAKKLNNSGIKTTDDLLDVGGTKQGRKEVAEKTGISCH